MCKDVLITGVKVTDQMKKAKEILNRQVIPKEIKFKKRKQLGTLSPELISAMKLNA